MDNMARLAKAVSHFKSDVPIEEKIKYMDLFVTIITEIKKDLETKWGQQSISTERERREINCLCKDNETQKQNDIHGYKRMCCLLSEIMLITTEDKVCLNKIKKFMEER